MLLVLDSNEYIFAVVLARQSSSATLLDVLLKQKNIHTVRIPRLVLNEIRRNVPGNLFRDIMHLIHRLTHVDEDLDVPFELGDKYEAKRLKHADAFIAAYTEWVGADVLVTENRHFLKLHVDLPFRICTAEQALKRLAA